MVGHCGCTLWIIQCRPHALQAEPSTKSYMGCDVRSRILQNDAESIVELHSCLMHARLCDMSPCKACKACRVTRLCFSACWSEPKADAPESAYRSFACASTYTGCAIAARVAPLAGGANRSEDRVYDKRYEVACAVFLTLTMPTYILRHPSSGGIKLRLS